jgi:hypothetical protein
VTRLVLSWLRYRLRPSRVDRELALLLALHRHPAKGRRG